MLFDFDFQEAFRDLHFAFCVGKHPRRFFRQARTLYLWTRASDDLLERLYGNAVRRSFVKAWGVDVAVTQG